MENVKKSCNIIMDLLKFVFNKKILSIVIIINYDQICNQTLYLNQ